jgi:predicted DCC family thiol-disulfide oxidoreductase YuxK
MTINTKPNEVLLLNLINSIILIYTQNYLFCSKKKIFLQNKLKIPMTHLFKVQLQHSDMFVKGIDLEKSTITYQIREKDTGKSMESEITVPFFINEVEQKIEFSGGRYIAIGLAALINQVLNVI